MKGRRKSTHYVCMPRRCPSINSSNAVSLSTATGPDPVMIRVGDSEWKRRNASVAVQADFFSLHLLFACQKFIHINISVGVCSYIPNARHHSVDTTSAVQRAGVNADNTNASVLVDDHRRHRRWRVTIKFGVNPQSLAHFPTVMITVRLAVIFVPDLMSVKLTTQPFLLRLTKISPQGRTRRQDNRNNKTFLCSVSTLSNVDVRSVPHHFSQHQRLHLRHQRKDPHWHKR
jgi:hypothetical protein